MCWDSLSYLCSFPVVWVGSNGRMGLIRSRVGYVGLVYVCVGGGCRK